MPHPCLLRRMVLCAWVALAATAACADGPTDQSARLRNVQAYKLDSAIVEQLAEARRLQLTERDQADALLKRVKATLEMDELLTRERRRELLSLVNQRLQDRSAPAQPPLPAGKTTQDVQRDMYITGQPRLGPQDTSDPYLKSKQALEAKKQEQALQEKLRKDREKGVLGVLGGLDRSAVPPATDSPFTLPAHWKQIVKMRPTGPKLTKDEEALLNALNMTLAVDFNGKPFREVIEYLQVKTGQTILLDKTTLQEAMIEYDTPVTVKLPKVSMRTVLKKVLADQGLTFILRGAMIEVVTPQKARDTLVAHTYDISSVLPTVPANGGPLALAKRNYDANQLIQQIITSVDPASWQANGGSGSITFVYPNTLVVRSSAELHHTLKSSMLGR